MIIFGIGGILHDASCAVLKDGDLVAAIEQRKIARVRGPGELPEESIAACLRLANVKPEQIDCVVVVRPLAAGPEASLHMELRARFPKSKVILVDHQMAHAASAYYPTPFESATVLTLDRLGDFRCGARWRGAGNHLQLEKELYYPDSLGDLYGRVTELLGFEPNADEHKVQWLSAYGDGRFTDVFRDVLGLRDGEWPSIDRSYFNSDRHTHGGFSSKFYERLGLAEGVAVPESKRMQVAAGLQRAIEQAALEMAGEGENLCLGGGLSYNALLVAALERSGRWKNVFVQPAAGNAGTSLGAVFYAWHAAYGQTSRGSMKDLCLGPGFTADEIKQVLENCKLRFRYLLTTDELIEKAVEQVNNNRIIAWMHGRMEFGPRALGNRSILASPLNPYSTENLNVYIKHREPFRKFAASVPAELAGEYFEVGANARFLATVGRVRPKHRKTLESAVLGEETVRVHTVTRDDNPLYWRLLQAFGKATGLPVLYNTSFNLFGDPIVCTPRDAVRSFYSSGIDSLFVGNFFLDK
ncbi:MAG: carbamoyltransferase [Bryobacteraceae bacterium]|nr:carbamoyltransferase [Bryobacteraceae bacterium]